MYRCDIIIPTYNSDTVIAQTVRAVFEQKEIQGWQIQVIIADDGSRDKTIECVKKIKSPENCLPTQIITGRHAGAARTRNKAVDKASGNIILFLGADTIMRPTTLKQHLRFHKENPDYNKAALGGILWDPRMKPSPLMEWMMHGGPQNDFDTLLGKKIADPRHFFYGANISLKRMFIGSNPFPTAYNQYGWEDLECGRKLAEKGLQLHVLHGAIVVHNHTYTVADICRRQYNAGRGLVIYQRRYPDQEIAPAQKRYKKWLLKGILGKWALHAIRQVITWTAPHKTTPGIFKLLTTGYLRQGMYAEEKGYNKSTGWL